MAKYTKNLLRIVQNKNLEARLKDWDWVKQRPTGKNLKGKNRQNKN